MTSFGLVGALVLVVALCIGFSSFLVLGYEWASRKRWKVIGEGIVEDVETLEVPAGIMPLENGFIAPAVSATYVRFTDGKKVEIPYDQVKLCVKGKRIQVHRSWTGRRQVIQMTLF